MAGSPDPLGKRALFGDGAESGDADRLTDPHVDADGGAGDQDSDVDDATGRDTQSGKRALFSQSEAKRGSMVLECSHCHARTPISLSELASKLITAPIFFPFRPHRRLMRCPACRDTTWVTVKRG